jgi:hypothetical protein
VGFTSFSDIIIVISSVDIFVLGTSPSLKHFFPPLSNDSYKKLQIMQDELSSLRQKAQFSPQLVDIIFLSKDIST